MLYLCDRKLCPHCVGFTYCNKKKVIDKAKKKPQRSSWQTKSKAKGKARTNKGKDNGKDMAKDKKKGKGKICLYFNDKGCHYCSACKMLQNPAMAAPIPVRRTNAAAAPKAAAAMDPAKP